MADLTELLEDAAAPVASGPDLAAITERAGALRRRTVAMRAAAAAVAVAAVVPVILLDGGGGTEELRQSDTPVGPATTSPVTATPITPQVAPSPRTSASPGQGVVVPVPGGPRIETRRPEPVPSGTRHPALERLATASPAPSSGSEDFPPAASCSLTTRDLQTDTERTCRFTATKDGGWQITRGAAFFAGYDPGDYRVQVVRDGKEVYDTLGTEWICESDVILSGDLVTLLLESNPNNYEDVELAAGEGYGC